MRKSIKILFLIIPISFMLAGRVYPIEIGSLGGKNGNASYPIDLASGTEITGILPITQGGTGSNTAAGARTKLELSANHYVRFKGISIGSSTDASWIGQIILGDSVNAGIYTDTGVIISPTELEYLDGVSSNVQTQLNARLVASNNLSDVSNTSTTRTNLGLGTLATANAVALGTDTTGILPLTEGGWGTDTTGTIGMVAGKMGIGTNTPSTTLHVVGTITASNMTVDTITVTQKAILPSHASTTGSASTTVGGGQSYTINATGSATNTIVLNTSGTIIGTNTGSADFTGLQGGTNLGSATLNYSNLVDSMRIRPVVFQDFHNNLANLVDPFAATAISSGSAGGPSSLDLTNHPGVVSLVGSSSVNSGYMYRTIANDRNLSKGAFFDCEFMIDAVSTVRLGFFDTSTFAEPTDSACLFLPGTLTVYGNTSVDGTKGTTTTNYTLTIDTWYRGVGELGSSSTSFSFSIYNEAGSLLWTDSLSTNLATATGKNFGCGIISTAIDTSAQNMTYVDYIAFGNKQPLTR